MLIHTKLNVVHLLKIGNQKIGLKNKILMVGFNGIVVFIEVEELKMIKDKLIDGLKLPDQRVAFVLI